MKKVLVILLLVCCVSFCFAGCDSLKGEYWLDTQAVAEAVFKNENFEDVYTIDYGDNLTTIMNAEYGSDYAEVKNVLAPLFNASISYAYKHYSDLLQNPKNSNDASFKNSIKKVNSNLKEFEVAVNTFKQQKDLYLSYVTASDEEFASKSIEKARLLNFKRNYITFIEVAFDLSESIFQARRLGYYDYSDYSCQEVELVDANADCSLAVNASNLVITKCAIEIVRAYNAKEVASAYENYYKSSQEFFEIVNYFENNEYTLVEGVKNALSDWKIVYDMFTEENEKLLNVLNKIDLELLIECGNNASSYALETKNASDEYYANYYLNFYRKIDTLKTYVLNFFE